MPRSQPGSLLSTEVAELGAWKPSYTHGMGAHLGPSLQTGLRHAVTVILGPQTAWPGLSFLGCGALPSGKPAQPE